MTAPTHLAFSLLCGSIGSTDYLASAACAIGSLLPDLDHPRSSIGRVFFFLSHPLNMRFGHRGLIHSFFLWTPLLIVGMIFKLHTIQWLAIGALSHVLIDCYNTSGVRAFTPFSDKSVVMFKRDWRVSAGSLGEIYVFILIALLLPAAHFTQSIGGWRKLTNLLIQSHKITVEEYTRAGTRICYVNGQFRWTDGRLEDVNWLIVGLEGQNLVYFDGTKLIHEDKHGQFLKSKLRQTDADWISVKLQGVGIVKTASFFYDGKKWYYALCGSKVMGIVRSANNAMPEIQINSSLENVNSHI
jgi:membrane-bound metal-dependent hydrolase YbcI (DUF457 family)